MTVATEISEVEYVGNGVTTEWDFDFPVHQKSDLDLYLYTISTEEEQLLNAGTWDFELTNSDAYTGFVTYPLTGSPISSSYKVILRRNVPVTQELDAANQRALPPASAELQLDRTTMQVADTKRIANKALSEVSALAAIVAQLALGISPSLSIYAGMLDNFNIYNPMEPRFGAEGDGLVDDTEAVQAAYAAAEANGRGMVLINHPHRITDTIICTSGRVVTYSPSPYTGYFLCDGDFTALKYSLDAIRTDGSPHIEGIGVLKTSEDTDNVAIRVESAALVGDAEGETSGANKGPQFINLRIDSSEGAEQAVTAATQANPVVLTVTAHGLATGDVVRAANFEGMTDLNDREFEVTVINANTFSLNDENGLAYPAYQGGGVIAKQADGYWKYGIQTKHCPHARFLRCWIKGRGAITTTKIGAGISLGHYCNGSQVFECNIRGFYGGVHIDDTEFFNKPARANSTAYAVGAIITVSSNNQFRFVCTTTGTSAGSLPAGYATAGNRDEVTDGSAVFVGAGYQSEGISIEQNVLQSNYHGVYSSITSVENSWRICNNGMDNGRSNVWLRNGIRITIADNQMGWNNRKLDHVDIYLERTDGASAEDAYKVVGLIRNNVCFRGGNLSLVVSGITRGATTTLSYTKSASDPHPVAGDYLFLGSVEGTTELNNVPFKAGTVVETNSTSGTVIMLDYVSGANINSSGYGAFTNAAYVVRYGRFVELGTARNVNIEHNTIASRSVGAHLAALTEDITYLDNSWATGVVRDVYSLSSSPTTITIASHPDALHRPEVFLTRADFVTAVADKMWRADGVITIAAGLQYKWQSGSTAISDLPGLVPVGDVTPQHWGLADGGTMTDAILSALVSAAGNRLSLKGLWYWPEGSSGLALTSKTDFTLHLENARIVQTGNQASEYSSFVTATACTNISITGSGEFDFQSQPYFQGTVTAVGASTVDILVDSGFTPAFTTIDSVHSFGADGLKPEVFTTTYVSGTTYAISLVSGSTWRISGLASYVSRYTVGDRVVAINSRYAKVGFNFVRCDNVYIAPGVRIYAASGQTIRCEGCNGGEILAKILRKPGTTRMASSVADGVHLANCRGEWNIDGMTLDGLLDDAVNVNTAGMNVSAVGSATTFTASMTIVGRNYIEAGDTLVVRDSTGASVGTATVASVSGTSPTGFTVTTTGAHGVVDDTYWVENISCNPKRAVIRNNRLSMIAGAGIVPQAQDLTVSHNVIDRVWSSAIKARAYSQYFYEGVAADRVNIEYNVCTECANGAQNNDNVITVNGIRYGAGEPTVQVLTGAHVAYNTIRGSDHGAIDVGHCTSPFIGYNLLSDVCRSPNAVTPTEYEISIRYNANPVVVLNTLEGATGEVKKFSANSGFVKIEANYNLVEA